MKLSQLIRTILNLLGIYTIFTTIVAGGMTTIGLLVTIFYEGMGGYGISLLMLVFQFVAPLLLGIIIIWKSQKITEWVLVYSGIDPESGTERLEIKEFPFVAFSLLGLYMLSQTIPSMCHFIAYLFQTKAQEVSYLSIEEGKFLEQHLADIIYHAVAVGFSFLVFMKGKSFAKFALSLRKQ